MSKFTCSCVHQVHAPNGCRRPVRLSGDICGMCNAVPTHHPAPVGGSGEDDDQADYEPDHMAEMLTPRCRICGCTDMMACAEGCGWAAVGLCTSCVEAFKANSEMIDAWAFELSGVLTELLTIRIPGLRPAPSDGANQLRASA